MSEFDKEMRDTIFEVLKKQAVEDWDEKVKILKTSDLLRKRDFSINDVLSETEELLSKGRDINNLTERVRGSFEQLGIDGYLIVGKFEGDPHPHSFYLTDRGEEKLKGYM